MSSPSGITIRRSWSHLAGTAMLCMRIRHMRRFDGRSFHVRSMTMLTAVIRMCTRHSARTTDFVHRVRQALPEGGLCPIGSGDAGIGAS